MEVTGLVASASVPLIKHAWTVGRGGAAFAAASTVSSLAQKTLTLRGGATATAKKAPVKPAPKKTVKVPVKPALKKTERAPLVTPRAKSVLFMAIAMAFHYLGYSLARPITISLFTSAKTGYGASDAAFPFAMAFVSPMSLALLLGYGKVLEKHGPKGALKSSTMLCAFIMSASAIAIEVFEKLGTTILDVSAQKFVSGPLFVFRESYVQLLTSQYWSFMASALTPAQSAKWFGPIAGLTSITSALAGFGVSDLINRIGICYALLGTGLTLMMSLLAVDVAYRIAEENNFAPTAKKHGRPGPKKGIDQNESMFRKARTLFARVPILKKLFMEILASQGLATILNVAFVSVLKRTILDDNERAGWVGKFFSTINVITMVLQFGLLPPILSIIEPRVLWRIVPLVALGFTSFQATQEDPTLYIVSATLLVMKVLEYSARRTLDEMVFVPLDFESRFLGKEVIGVFGYRFGKSLMSLGLSGLNTVFGNFGIQEYSIMSALVNLVWFKTAWSLSNYVPTRKEAEDTYNLSNKKNSRRPATTRK